MTGALAAFHRDSKISRLPLRGFDDLEVLALLEALAGHEMDEDGLMLRDALRTETAGNPFFATEILRHLSETGAIARRDGRWRATTDLDAHGLPVSVREVIGHRVSRLGAQTRNALSNAAVIGREFDLSLLAELAGLDAEAMLETLMPAVDATLLQEVAPERFAFAHALVAHALYDDLGATRRARLHRAYAEVLERHAASEAASVAELAHHWSLATTPEDTQKAAAYARLAGNEALATLAPIEAAHWFQRALELTAVADDRAQCELRVALGEAQRQAGDSAYRETLLDASTRAIDLGDDNLLVQAALANNRGTWSESGSMDEDRVRILRSALRAPSTDIEAAVLRALLAAELQPADLMESRAVADDALARARATGDPRTFARVVRLVEGALREPATLDRRRRLLEEAEAAALNTRDAALRAQIAVGSQGAALESADVDEHDRHLTIVTTYAEQSPEPYPRWSAMWLRSLRLLLTGDTTGAEAASNDALQVGSASGQPDAFAFYAGQLYEIRRAQGRLAEILPTVERIVAENPGLHVYRAVLALALCDTQRLEDANAVARPDLADTFQSFPCDGLWGTSMLLWAEVCRHLNAVKPAQALVASLEPWRTHVATTGITCGGSLAYGLGLSLATAGDSEQAVEAFEQALDVNRRLGAPILVARTEADFAWALRDLDPNRTRALAQSAAATADRLGLGTIGKRANDVLDALASDGE
jgi:tetratricopeptide (TPR) repeat protein